MQRLVLTATVVATVATYPRGAAMPSSESALLAASAPIVQAVQTTIPADVWGRARCIAVFPELKNTSFIVGGKSGKGILSCHANERWSAPAFVKLHKGSRMSQLGAQE